jgi:4-hydroxythreonine-4-phosphate dehydrogenase
MEIIIKTLSDPLFQQSYTTVVYGSGKIAGYYRKNMNLNDFSFNIINSADEIKSKKANLVNVWNEEVVVNMGQSNETGGKYALRSLEAATKDLAAGKIDVLVTAPINKQNIQSEKFNFPGHTEYLAKMSNVNDALMLMVSGDLRIGVVTGHIPINQVSQNLSKDKIMRIARILNQSLIRDFSIRKPKIAILGLNPHAGDNGLIGEEDKNIIEPAISALKNEGILTFGPYSADGFFGSGNHKNFDGILAMYHDQGLIPFKTLSFGSGVNYTAGLPIVRTSPDHGTAYDLV